MSTVQGVAPAPSSARNGLPRNPVLILCTAAPVQEIAGHNVIFMDYVNAGREVAKTENVPLLDGVHPNDLGHRLIADALLCLIASM